MWLPKSYPCWRIPFASQNASGVLNTFRNNGVPANESGLAGPTVMKEYCLDPASSADWGSRND